MRESGGEFEGEGGLEGELEGRKRERRRERRECCFTNKTTHLPINPRKIKGGCLVSLREGLWENVWQVSPDLK